MVKFRITGAIVSLMLAIGSPAFAGDARNTDGHHHKKHLYAAPPPTIAYGDPHLPVQNALRWGYSQGYSNYPSGFGGLYGDGRYPGNTISNPNWPTWW